MFAKPIAKAIEKAFACNRCGISVIGMEVPHAHMHLLPIDSGNDLNFTRPKLKLSPAQLADVQQKDNCGTGQVRRGLSICTTKACLLQYFKELLISKTFFPGHDRG